MFLWPSFLGTFLTLPTCHTSRFLSFSKSSLVQHGQLPVHARPEELPEPASAVPNSSEFGIY